MNEEKILNNWNKLIKLITDSFSGDRQKQLLDMYTYFKDRMMFTPASSHNYFHNCFPGGYVEHILNIVQYVKDIKNIWYNNGATIDYTDEELIFAAMHHDLGKIGDMDSDHYLPNPSEWHRKNLGKIYTANSDIQFMSPPDRGIWILNQFGIKMTVNEMLGIKLADGLYDEGNLQYLKSYAKEKKIKSNLPLIIHQADMMTTRIEYEQSLVNLDDTVNTKVTNNTKLKQTKTDYKELKSEFDKLFN
jgi:hypothetical protein